MQCGGVRDEKLLYAECAKIDRTQLFWKLLLVLFLFQELANGDQQSTTPQSTLNRNYKMVSRALYNFQAQNYRELSFKKGDLVYIRRQVRFRVFVGLCAAHLHTVRVCTQCAERMREATL